MNVSMHFSPSSSLYDLTPTSFRPGRWRAILQRPLTLKVHSLKVSSFPGVLPDVISWRQHVSRLFHLAFCLFEPRPHTSKAPNAITWLLLRFETERSFRWPAPLWGRSCHGRLGWFVIRIGHQGFHVVEWFQWQSGIHPIGPPALQ